MEVGGEGGINCGACGLLVDQLAFFHFVEKCNRVRTLRFLVRAAAHTRRALAIHTISNRARVGGEGGIRTRGTLRYTRFPIVHLRPLGHFSKIKSRVNVAERGGFEPPVAFATLDFESSTFDRSDTPPGNQSLPLRPSRMARKKLRKSWAHCSPATPLVTGIR